MFICIEGNIGCGKSSVLKAFAERGLVVFPEPLEKWTLLEDLYRDPERYAFPFQMQVVLSQIEMDKELKKLPPNHIKIMERSVWASRNVFSNLRDWPDAKNDVMASCYDLVESVPDVYVFLDQDPAVCRRRIAQRNRYEERNISQEYLDRLDAKYRDELAKLDNVVSIRCGDMTTEEIVEAIRSALSI